MLSLLIISNNPKAKLIQDSIQPLLETEIGLVADFEQGLNELFDKNPATVIIHERIEGVSCDAVVRYVRQMLGSDAPTFIMTHEGNAGIRPEKGLCEVVVDLNQSNEMLVAEVSSLLDRIAGGEQLTDAGLQPHSQPISVEPAHGAAEARIEPGTLAEEPLPDPNAPSAGSEAGNSRQPRILLVEDNLISQQLTLARLINLGYKVDIAPNGQKAITALESINYDLVIMDWLMPLMDGLEATARIRDKQSKVLNHDVPVIALTSNKEPGDREKCLEAGMSDYLVKPVKKDYLAEVLEKWLKNPRADGSEQPPATEAEEQAGSEKRPPKKKPAKAAKAATPSESEALASDQAVASPENQALVSDIFARKPPEESLSTGENLEQVIAELTLKLQNAVEQLQDERAEREEAEEQLNQARMAAEAANEQLQVELAKRKEAEERLEQARLAAEAADEQLQIEFAVHKDAEEKSSQARIAAESANEQLQAELAEHKNAEEKLNQARLAAEAVNEQLQIERAEHEDAEEKLNQARLATEAVNEQLQAEHAEREAAEELLKQARMAAEAADEQLQVEFGAHKDAEEKLNDARIATEAVVEQLRAELAERIAAEEQLNQARIAAEAANELLKAENAERQQLESSLQQSATELNLELQTVVEQLQVELAEREDAEEKLKQAKIAAEAENEQLQAELAEREEAEEQLKRAKTAAEAANEQLQVELVERKNAAEKLNLALIAAESAREQLQIELADALRAPAAVTGTINAAPSPTDFYISTSTAEEKELFPEEKPLAFAEKSPSGSRNWIVLLTALVLLSSVAGGLYLFKKKPQTPPVSDGAKTAAPVATPTPGAKTPLAVKQPAVPSPPSPPDKKAITSQAKPVPALNSPLPSFVTVSGRDKEYSVKNPGWERYVDSKHDVRIYRLAGKIKAVQVLAAKSQVIASSFMRTALREVSGRSEYKEISREVKEGFLIQRNSVGPKSKLTVYRMQPSEKISAFVVKLE